MTNEETDIRAAAALMAEAGLEWAEAERLVAILRRANVMRSTNGIKAAKVEAKIDADPHVAIEFEDGRRISGRLVNDIVATRLTYPSPF